jgi:hypothetical protein
MQQMTRIVFLFVFPSFYFLWNQELHDLQKTQQSYPCRRPSHGTVEKLKLLSYNCYFTPLWRFSYILIILSPKNFTAKMFFTSEHFSKFKLQQVYATKNTSMHPEHVDV